ncbi:MAG TPA: DivIVA domain-containing protein [Candidatus Avoscillospira avicola]|uniref:DivIVA domain-containing protein n=1 Tax=Candidatus Avoscillospira avicola TaxID=2840706 RepID=A0A9D1IY79_9FIRM|nr:DivIVA domain-containing protein [Candidatus Avoscillospira avicola]
MFTPQEIQEKTFTKAVFGGYDMQTVDDFLEPLTEDYITLYKENAVLKSKMKVLVEKLEEYRSQEQSMRKAILSAQRTADAMVAEAEKKCARLMADAATTAQDKTSDAETVVSQEQERINCAKKAAQNFIEVIERDIRGHLDLLESLKSRDMSLELQQPAPRKAFDYDAEAEKPLVVPKPKAAPQPTPQPAPTQEPAAAEAETTEEIAHEIEQNLSRMMDVNLPEMNNAAPGAKPAAHTDSSTIKFTNLQFGRNYDPTSGT